MKATQVATLEVAVTKVLVLQPQRAKAQPRRAQLLGCD